MKKHSKDTKPRQGGKGTTSNKTPKKPKDPKPLKSTSKTEPPLGASDTPTLPTTLQNTIISLFQSTFSNTLTSPDFKTILQEVKGALFDRDFERAFGKEEYLEAYAARWSPSRALGYADLLVDLRGFFAESGLPVFVGDDGGEGGGLDRDDEEQTLHVTCLGGGAAEVVAVGGMLRRILQDRGLFEQSSSSKLETETAAEADPPLPSLTPLTIDDNPSTQPQDQDQDHKPKPTLHITLLDTAPWGPLTTRLTTALTTPPPLSKYASATHRASNTALLPPNTCNISTSFHQVDLLSLSPSTLSPLLQQHNRNKNGKPGLITLLFTLNELYNTSIAKTTALLLQITACVPRGTMLLVVDSPGSYSVAKLGGGAGTSAVTSGGGVETGTEEDAKGEAETRAETGRQYPMQWLMDHTLLQQRQGARKRGRKDEEKGAQAEEEDEEEEEEEEEVAWEKVLSEDSRWFRIPEGVGGRYPIPLENMRFQVHLYRRL